MMPMNKISLREAYMIETLRSNGISDQEILTQAQKGATDDWAIFNPDFEFHGLVELNEQDPEAFQSIIKDGYKVKFVTFKGVQTLLKLKFGFEEEQHYELTGKGITGLQVTDAQLAEIRQVLSMNWGIGELSSETSGQKTIKIELA